MTPHSSFIIHHSSFSFRVGVDLIPLLPGGENGGAKFVAVELVRHMSRLAPDWEFILLTSEKSNDELAFLDSANVRRLCASKQKSDPESPMTGANRLENLIRRRLNRFLPMRWRVKLEHAYRKAVTRSRQGGFFSQVGIDLLFCPFTAPSFHDLSVPAVSIIHDLQYRYYPQFFSPEDHQCRMINFMEACRLSDRLICVSEYVRRTVLENSDLKSDRVCTIHTRLPNRVSEPAPQAVSSVLRRLGLRENEFFLYPANFWEHKNHRMLLTAFGMVHARNPGSNLRLVCPGALEKERRAWREAADRMGLGERIVLPGFMLDDDYAAILASCLALVFPSLFEGFGMPVLEAMAFRKPVICSNVTSLPEVAGDAALFIDPRNPRDMAEAMERMATDETLRKSLIDLGRRRLEVFGGPDTMAREYLDVFLNVMRQPRPTTHTKLRSR